MNRWDQNNQDYFDADTYECALADVCLSDCWCGHHRAHISVPVDNAVTLAELKEALKDELNQGAVAGSVDWEIVESDMFYAKAKAAIDAIETNSGKDDSPVFPDLEDTDDDCESVYAYFVFIPEYN